jgi:hypothetical protein
VSAITSAQPPGGRFVTAAIPVSEFEDSEQPVQGLVAYIYVQGDYFETVGVPLLQGRSFEGQEQAVVLSQSAAREFWPDENPVGQSLRLGPTDERFHRSSELVADGPAYRVVGVVQDKRGLGLSAVSDREVYLPLAEQQLFSRPILIRTGGNPEQVMSQLGPLLTSIDPTISATADTLEQRLWQNPLFAVSMLFGAFASAVGTCALLLALMGIYGTVSYIVVLRTREVGIRRAVGAQRSDVIRLVLRESMRPILIGLILGMPLAAGGSYLATRMLPSMGFLDFASTAGVTLLFLGVALVASYFPARRALNIDPLAALRHDG